MRSLAGIIAIAGALIASPALAAKKYKGGAVKDGGVIRGSVVFKGPVPRLQVVIPQKDRATCGNDREQPALIVGPTSGIRDVIVYIKKIKQGKPWAKPAKAAVLRNVKCRFEPHVQVMRKGKLTVVSEDPILHNTHGFYGKRTAFNMALPKMGERIEASLRADGSGAHGMRRPRLDARLCLCGQEPLLGDHRRGRGLRHDRRFRPENTPSSRSRATSTPLRCR